MNSKIRNVDLEKILFFDAETVSRNKDLDPNSREFNLYAWSIRDKTTGFIPPAAEVKKHYAQNAALKPEFNKLVVISVGYIKGTTLFYKALTGTQKEIIETFYDIVRDTGFKLSGHNIIGFDVPVIRMKSFEEGLDPATIPNNAMDSGKKPWDLEDTMLDTMAILKGTYFYSMSLDAACMLRGIPSSKDDISGPMVTKTYYQEGVERIAQYCNKDVIASAQLFCSLQGKHDYLTTFIDKNAEDLKEKETVPLMTHIANKGSITEAEAVLIKNFSKENNLNLDHVITLATAGVSNVSDLKGNLDLDNLKAQLLGKVDTFGIEEVVELGNLSKKLADQIIKNGVGYDEDQKKNILVNLEKYLQNEGKMSQKRCNEAFKLISDKWEQN
jgi:hypothetical protein